jgi:hypothetical protein
MAVGGRVKCVEQELELERDHWPFSQSAQLVISTGLALLRLVVAPKLCTSANDIFPAGQAWHWACPDMGWNCPPPQVEQNQAPAMEKRPGLHVPSHLRLPGRPA